MLRDSLPSKYGQCTEGSGFFIMQPQLSHRKLRLPGRLQYGMFQRGELPDEPVEAITGKHKPAASHGPWVPACASLKRNS